MDAGKRARLEAAGWRFGTVEEFLGLTPDEAKLIELRLEKENTMAKKKQTGGANESKWVREPTAAPDGHRFCDVAYEQRCHRESIEVLGVTFEPGQITTYRSRADVPGAMLEHPELMARDVAFGVCRIDPMHRYTALTLFAYETLKAGVAEPEISEVDEAPSISEPAPEGGE